MDRILQEQISRVERRASESLGLALIDVDHFKSYNDSFGHAAGDDLLRLLGGVLVSAVRPYDCVARIGGEEFAILLMDTSPEEAARVLERLRASVAQTCWPRRAITVSAGFCQWRPGMSQHALFEAADQRLYEAKRRGRNCVVVGSANGAHEQ